MPIAIPVSDEQQQGGSLHAAISAAITGRPVTAFLSDNHIDPDVGIECFQLGPRADGA